VGQLQRAWRRAEDAVRSRVQPFWFFLTPEARAINRARQDHLASLGLPLDGTSVLEVGAGIGLHTGFFEQRGCQVLSTDGRPENVAEIRRRHPERNVRTLDLERPDDIRALGHFDVVYCYGTLYHLSSPGETLDALAAVSDMILLETCVTPGHNEAVNPVSEMATVVNKAQSGEGCRPTRPWVMHRVRDGWGFAYLSKTQPSHPEFPLDWSVLATEPHPTHNTRAVFVGANRALDNDRLVSEPIDHQEAVT